MVEALRKLGHDVQTTRDAGKDGKAVPDVDVLEHAAENARILLTGRGVFCGVSAVPDH